MHELGQLHPVSQNRFGFHSNKQTSIPSEDSYDGFRLSKASSSVTEVYKCETESIASSSVTSKHRIDMMFNDSRSVTSEYHVNRHYHEPSRKVKSLIEGFNEETGNYKDSKSKGGKNDVQKRIEKMFSEVSSSEREVDKSLKQNKFPVKHLGSLPAQYKITSLEGLQDPLTDLYFKYRFNNKKETTGNIQINEKGLNIEYDSNFGGKIEKLSSFSTIAIWASVKFTLRRTNDSTFEHAFLPIVASAGSDKNTLYHKSDDKYTERLRSEHFNDAIFVVVMREPDTPIKQLICHGFICQSSEDAVVMAATLYKVLMSKLGKNRVLKGRNQRRRIRQQYPNRLSSIGEISSNELQEQESSSNYLPNIPSPPPIRPPRKPKELSKLPVNRNTVGTDAVTVSRKDSMLSSNVETGDVLTKVAIPRSSSFLNTNRLGSRYKSDMTIEQTLIPKTGSPLGFMEMFNELQSQEGLKTVDEILNVIINAEGMSFNELKPIYKEFLLKLALVLNKDELYNRSKTIMKKQKIKGHKSSKLRKVIVSKKRLKNVFHKPLVKLKVNKDTSKSSKVYNDSTSTDSFFLSTKAKPDVVKLRPTKTTNVRHKAFQFKSRRIISTSEDSDYPNIDHQRKYIKSKTKETDLRPSSSGYFSFSECSYDTESCTCTSADKCYCSLSKDANPTKVSNFTICSCDTIACRKRNKCYCAKSKKLSLVEQLKRKGFAISESSLSPDDSHKSKVPTKDKNFSKLSKSLEYLEKNQSNKYKSRMDLYEATGQKVFPCKHSYKYCPSVSSASSRSQKHSTSSDNLAVDYSLFARAEEYQANHNNVFQNYRRPPALNKPNVIYAELARPLMTQSRNSVTYKQRFPEPPERSEESSGANVYHHRPLRTCNCACACAIYTSGAGAYTSCYDNNNSSSFVTPFHRINMENIFGYYP